MTATPKELKYLRWIVAGAPIFSTCLRRQYMALIIARNGRVIGVGYNGSPPGMRHCVDGACPRARGSVAHGSSYSNCIAVHAEANALLWSDQTLREGATLIVNGPPCHECGRLIAGSGIARVVHLTDDAYAEWPRVRDLLVAAGVEVVTVEPEDDSDDAFPDPWAWE